MTTTTSPTSAARAATSPGTGSGTPYAVDLRGLVKTFGDVRAVGGIDLQIRPGEIVALLGPNGAGKTSTVDLVLGLSRPTEGSVEVFGQQPAHAVQRGLVSAVMQTGGLLKDFTVGETVRFTAALFASSRPVDEVLQRAGIADIADRRVGKCSGGQQQRLRFALALLPDPELLVLDEPTTGMDVEGRRDFWNAMREDARQGRTVIFATHYLQEADEFADRIVMMRKGQIVADGTTEHVKALAGGRVVRATLPGAGDPTVTAALYEIPGVQDVTVRHDAVAVVADDSDAVARFLLTRTAARDLEVAARNLDDAFLALTGDPTSTSTSTEEK